MNIKKIIRPGDPGIQKITKQYGSKLVCVRYRYDQEKQIRYKTAEIILDEKPWKPDNQRIPGNKLVMIRIGKFETTIQALVQSHGGKLDPESNNWILPYRLVKELDLHQRLIN